MPRRNPTPLDSQALWEYALRTLSSRAMSTGDLRARLRRRAAEPADIEGVIQRLNESGLLNDQRFADSYATARLENQGFGKMRVLRDLRQRRVASSVADQAIHQAYQDTDEPALIEQYLARKYRGKDLSVFLSEDKNLMSAYRRLRAAGFSSGPAINVLKRYAASRSDELAGLEDAEPLEE
jgi:regulatory protein